MLPTLVDDVTGDETISKLFAIKYDEVYNSVAYNEEDMSSLSQDIHSQYMYNVVTVKILLL